MNADSTVHYTLSECGLCGDNYDYKPYTTLLDVFRVVFRIFHTSTLSYFPEPGSPGSTVTVACHLTNKYACLLAIWSLLTTYGMSYTGFSMKLKVGHLKSKMAEIRHLEHQYYVIFLPWAVQLG